MSGYMQSQEVLISSEGAFQLFNTVPTYEWQKEVVVVLNSLVLT